MEISAQSLEYMLYTATEKGLAAGMAQEDVERMLDQITNTCIAFVSTFTQYIKTRVQSHAVPA